KNTVLTNKDGLDLLRDIVADMQFSDQPAVMEGIILGSLFHHLSRQKDSSAARFLNAAKNIGFKNVLQEQGFFQDKKFTVEGAEILDIYRKTSKHDLIEEIVPAFLRKSSNSKKEILIGRLLNRIDDSVKEGYFHQNKRADEPGDGAYLPAVLFRNLEKRPYGMRRSQASDLPILSKLEVLCWPEGLEISGDKLLNRISRFPDGQWVAVLENKVVGALYSQRIDDPEALKSADMDMVEDLYEPQGKTVQLLAVNVHPDVQDIQIGGGLLEFVLQRVPLVSGVEKVVGVTRCRSYQKKASLPYDEYVALRNENGALFDPVLRYHELHGATIVQPLKGYRVRDKENDGFGVLVSYDIYARIRKDFALKKDHQVTGIPISDLVQQTIEKLLGDSFEDRYEPDLPLMEIGLDSADLMVLRETLEMALDEKISASFFFENSTAEQVIEALADKTTQPVLNEESIDDQVQSYEINDNDVAIIGYSFKFPGASTEEELWDVLINKKSSIDELPKDRFNWPHWIDTKSKHKGIDRGGYVADIDKFDAAFFRITPAEAELIDPQQRMMLELCWETIEKANYKASDIKGSHTGVFIGASGSDYELLLREHAGKDALTGTGTALALLPNRVSYFFDFDGPSMQIDTACSSSLVAINEAIKAMKQGECATAMVGAVNLICHPTRNLSYYQAQMLSKDGLCQTFDEKANGYVRGEGAAMLWLKPLKQAVADGDHVKGIIRGTAINHGGQAGGLTVPNPKKQRQLIESAYSNAGVDIHQVSYLEAHGTGTSLGDPIEIDGLKNAFNALANKELVSDSCGIGSVKTNLGHLEAAAGMAGVVKLLLSMKHQQLPPTNNFQNLNPKIELNESPFRIQREATKWNSPSGDNVLIAGVSSFGIGGANGHVVLQNFVNPAVSKNTGDGQPGIFVLSAKNETRLQSYAEKVIAFLNADRNVSLTALNYTFQTSREEMEARLALVYSSVDKLIDALVAFVQGDRSAVHFNKVKSVRKATPAKNIEQELLDSIAKDWVNGESINWSSQYEKTDIHVKIEVPTYPFAKDRHWQEKNEVDQGQIDRIQNKIHPLLHQNVSTLSAQKFRSTFTGHEYFLRDHKIFGQNMLPGVAYIELVAAAWNASTGTNAHQISNLNWIDPIVVSNAPKTVEVEIIADNNDFKFQVYSLTDSHKTIHAEGAVSERNSIQSKPIALASIQSNLKEQQSKSECYNLLASGGFEYGDSFQRIENFYFSDKEALAEIHLNEPSDMMLPPQLLDCALQSCMLQVLRNGERLLPYSVGEINIYQQLTGKIWCHIQEIKSGKLTGFDIQLLSDSGELLVELKEFYAIPAPGENYQTNVYDLVWTERSNSDQLQLSDTDQLVLLVNDHQSIAAELSDQLDLVVDTIGYHDEQSYFLEVLELVKNQISAKKKTQINLVYELNDQIDAGFMAGLFQSLRHESQNVSGKVIGLEKLSSDNIDNIADVLKKELQLAGTDIRYIDDVRNARQPVLINENSQLQVLQKATYLITGGAGGIGLLLAQFLIENYDAKVVILGRRAEADLTIELANEMHYYQADVTDLKGLKDTLELVRKDHGPLRGVFHAAGSIADAYIVNKTEKQVQQVLSAKVDGTRNIDLVTADDQLDFVVLFSSVSSAMGNAGQTDYAAANAFMDGFAHRRNHLVSSGSRSGFTTSINWSLWSEGGMQVDEESKRYLQEIWGMKPLPAKEGLLALEKILNSRVANSLVAFESDDLFLHKFEEQFKVKEQAVEAIGDLLVPSGNESLDYIKGLVCEVLKLNPENVEVDAHFQSYGIDSILINKITNRLDEIFGTLPRTLFFEYQTLEELAQYFAEEHAETLSKQINSNTVPSDNAKVAPSEVPIISRFKDKKPEHSAIDHPSKTEDIAIIGLSGKFPGADNLDEFWDNLKAGKDSVTVIPGDRWNAEELYDPEIGKAGKVYSKWGGFINDVDKFDPIFFKISPHEAEMMDPQERLFLQTSWSAIEDAGYTKELLHGKKKKGDIGGRVGVYVGVMYDEYQLFGAEQTMKGNPMAMWTNPSGIANRVSYFFDFHGPSMAIDTMCSSSITAIHLACEGLKTGDTDYAIAGGVNVTIHPNKYRMLSKGRFLSSEGKCESFGEGGEGYVPSEGVGAVLLKPLSKAEADGDRIYGVIKGSSLNHGGVTNGYTVPNPNAQADVIQSAINKAGVQPEDFSYLEAHGTGTSLGDPIEIVGLKKAFDSDSKQFCAIGSVKSNIGHGESAAGISGVAKVLLQMKHGKLVPSIHSKVLNKNIDFANSPFRVQQDFEDWNVADGKKRLAGISSFGAGGSNAHVVIEAYDNDPGSARSIVKPAIIVLSAKNKDRLNESVSNLIIHLERYPETALHDLAYTLQSGREHMSERFAAVGESIEEILTKLKSFASNNEAGNWYAANIRKHKNNQEDISIESLFVNANYEEIAFNWTKGVKVNWTLAYTDRIPRKISLPTYPFLKRRYWYDSYLTTENQTVKPIEISSQLSAQPVTLSDKKSYWDKIQDQQENSGKWYDTVKLTRHQNGIVEVSMQNKKFQNMLNEQLVNDLQVSFQKLRFDESVKVVILTGYDNIFCMGGSEDLLSDIANRKKRFTDLPFLFRGLLDFELPVIAAIQGHAFGGGLLFGLYGDIVIMSAQSTYSANFMKYGFTPGMGATHILGEKFGKQISVEMMMSAKLISGAEIKNRGASVIITDEVMEEAMHMANQMSSKPRNSLIVLKRKLSQEVWTELERHILLEEKMHEETFHTDEVKGHIEKHFGNHSSKQKPVVESNGKESQSLATKPVLEPVNQLVRKEIKPIKVVLNDLTRLPELSEKSSIQLPNVLLSDLSTTNRVESARTVERSEIPQVSVKKADDSSIKEKLTEIFSKILHIPSDELDEETDFIDLGVDSISGVEAIREINEFYKTDIEAISLYEFKTILQLSDLISTESGVVPHLETSVVYHDSSAVIRTYETADSVESANQAIVDNIIPELKGILEKILHIPQSDLDEDIEFLELGVDSISGVEIIREVNERYKLNLEAIVLYDYHSISKLYDLILSEGSFESAAPVMKEEQSNPTESGTPEIVQPASERSMSEKEILQQLKPIFEKVLHIGAEDLDEEVGFIDLGVDSISGVEIIREVNEQFKLDLEAVILYEYHTLEKLASLVQSLGISVPTRQRTEEISAEEPIKEVMPIAVPVVEEEQTTVAKQEPIIKKEFDDKAVTDIAIIGMSGRFPDAEDINQYWQNITGKVFSAKEVPGHKWEIDEFFSEDQDEAGKSYGKFLASLNDEDKFDPKFFNISPLEAEKMDPQQRLFLQESWKAIEDAGYNCDDFSGTKCGVFAGVTQSEYADFFGTDSLDSQVFTGNNSAVLSGRVSYYLNLQGPSFSIDTACSSSLVAIHQACESLRTGSSEVALAGGVYVMTSEKMHVMTSKAGMLNKTGQCRTFDQEADGFVPGEAVGVMVLKSLKQAEADGDHIYGVIKSSGINQDGKTNGITAPSYESQTRLETEVYEKGGINPETIGLIEAHGTGTKLGDPIEVKALKNSFSKFTDKTGFCGLGSVKSNIGHTLTASGVAGAIKATLALKNQIIPPTINFSELNEHIQLENSPFYISTEAKKWENTGSPRRAAVSSFGFSGTNAHAVIEEYQDIRTSAPIMGDQLILLSAKNESRLKEQVANLSRYLETNSQSDLTRIAYTLQTGRQPMVERLAAIAGSISDLKQQLNRYLSEEHGEVFRGNARKNKGAVYADNLSDLKQLAEHWVNGGVVDWKAIYGDHKPVKLPLPTYPFARERYWTENTRSAQKTVVLSNERTGDLIENQDINRYEVRWEQANAKPAGFNADNRSILIFGFDQNQVHFGTQLEGVEVHSYDAQSHIEVFNTVLDKVKSEVSKSSKSDLLVVVPNHSFGKYAFVSGLLKTIKLESDHVSGKVVGVSQLDQNTIDLLINSEINSNGLEVKYDKGSRFELKSTLVNQFSQLATNISFKNDGVYLISGGSGKLGQLIAHYLVERFNAKPITIGRRPQSEVALEAQVAYHQCDITSYDALEKLISNIKTKYGKIDGVIHAAGIIKDSLLVNKKEEEIKSVLDTKITGVINLDSILQNEPLDFFLSMSSIASIVGNIGQSDYASANSYLDYFAFERNEKIQQGKRFGKTISINWPLWKEGGMQVDSETEQYLENRLGIKPLHSSIALNAMSEMLNSGITQGFITAGDPQKLGAILAGDRLELSTESTVLDQPISEQIKQDVENIISELLKLPVDEIIDDEQFGILGFDSINLKKLSSGINKLYDIELMPMVFYNHPTVVELVDHLEDAYGNEISAVLSKKSVIMENSSPVIKSIKSSDHVQAETDKQAEPIAIIGMSGRFPQSPDLRTFWDNLEKNRDMVSEIPLERWDWKSIYGDPATDYTKVRVNSGGFISNADKFDPLFFNMSPREAELMDPQQRIALETVLHALEDAGIKSRELAGSNTGVFMGTYLNDYADIIKNAGLYTEAQSVTGLSQSVLTNRISYLLDLKGPSEPVDTACSSSLVSIRKGVENIRNGKCDLVLAGGVGLLLDPKWYTSLTQAGMLSKDGRCKTFDESANGYVRSEGVGVVVLKPLSQAEKDGDRIYGIIRGTSQNHGGKANTLTSPNPNAQSGLVVEAFKDAEVNPADVTYIETHGTGTPLGDPIETEGLKLAFDQLFTEQGITEKPEGYCALGSVKANVGHLEPAAGIVSVIKVLLAMKHGKLPGNPQLKTPNKFLKLDHTPFKLQRETTNWEAIDGKPRIAGISSFGFGGTNCHLIIEEYKSAEKTPNSYDSPALIVLSAKDQDRLTDYIEKLINQLQNDEMSIHDLAYTMQIGRDEMGTRLAVSSNSVAELITELKSYLAGTENAIRTGTVNEKKLQKVEDEFIKNLVQQRKWDSIIDLWLDGSIFNWKLLYEENNRPNVISVPGYAFARERYWATNEGIQNEIPAQISNGKSDMLLHQRISDSNGLKYTSSFIGNEPFLRDHVINDDRIFPGVAYLEMAMAGAMGVTGKPVNSISDVTWVNAFNFDQENRQLNTSFNSHGNETSYQIYSGDESDKLIHSEGKLLYTNDKLTSRAKQDVNSLKAGLFSIVPGDELYKRFETLGFQYGESFRGIEKIWYNTNESLASIKLRGSAGFNIPLGILDCALQACAVLAINKALLVPYSIGRLSIVTEIPNHVWCSVTRNEVGGNLESFHIQLLNEQGELVLEIEDFIARPLHKVSENATASAFRATWEEQEITPAGRHANEQVIIGGFGEEENLQLKEVLPFDVESLNETDPNSVFKQVFDIVQQNVNEKKKSKTILLFPSDRQQEFAFVSGLFKSLNSENPDYDGKTIAVDPSNSDWLDTVSSMLEAEFSSNDREVVYQHGKRKVKTIQADALLAKDFGQLTIRKNGVYLITGGAGGLGKITTQHLLQNEEITLILTGRRKASDLNIKGDDRLHYFTCDVSDANAVDELIGQVIDQFGKLNGVIHSAGIVADDFIINKTHQQIDDVLSPKISGTQNLDHATRFLDLDFFICYSALSGFLGNLGQSDYASANTYQDYLMKNRNILVTKGERKGKSISINWPLWENGGMQVDESSLEYLQNKWSLQPLPSAEGMQVFDSILNSGLDSSTCIPPFSHNGQLILMLLPFRSPFVTRI
ncbi:MAG: SDR family NAD(P)-dependent oxidoreductase, partial [Bacteroidota bacterium]